VSYIIRLNIFICTNRKLGFLTGLAFLVSDVVVSARFMHEMPDFCRPVAFALISVMRMWFYIRPTRHKIGHFGDDPQAKRWAWYGKTKPNTTKAHIHQSKEMYYNTK